MIRPSLSFILGLSLALGGGVSAPHAAAQGSAAQQLSTFDKTLLTGYVEGRATFYPAPDKKTGRYGAPSVYPVQVLFERPDRFRLVLDAGGKAEYRAVAEGGIVRWLDLATGVSGKSEATKLVDPVALGLLGSAGELMRLLGPKDVSLGKDSKHSGARLQPRAWATGVQRGLAWLGPDGAPVGFEFIFTDGARVFLAVSKFEQNPKTGPDDFKL